MLPFLQYPLRRSNTKQAPSTIRSIRASRDVETINAISVAERNSFILDFFLNLKQILGKNRRDIGDLMCDHDLTNERFAANL